MVKDPTFVLAPERSCGGFPGLSRTAILSLSRGVAQLGSALVLGTRGRGFESRRPDTPF